MTEEPKIYTVKEAAQLLHVHPTTVRNEIKRNRIEVFRVNGKVTGRIRITQTALDTYMHLPC